MKEVFVDKLKEFDFLIGDKEQKINKLNEDISNKNEEIKELEGKINELKEFSQQTQKLDAVLPKVADLEDGDLLEKYKRIKENFNFNASEVLKMLVSSNSKNNSEIFKNLEKIKEKFTFDDIYEISTYQASEQLTIIKELLKDVDIKLVEDLFNKKKFNVKNFLAELDKRIDVYNPKIKVFVGDKNINYDNIDSNIETIFSDDITEGFKIEYRGVIYDYSI